MKRIYIISAVCFALGSLLIYLEGARNWADTGISSILGMALCFGGVFCPLILSALKSLKK